VTVQGLVNSSHYNGMRGKSLGYNSQTGRFYVEMAGGFELNIKPANVVMASPQLPKKPSWGMPRGEANPGGAILLEWMWWRGGFANLLT
jgi:hypothetical protein